MPLPTGNYQKFNVKEGDAGLKQVKDILDNYGDNSKQGYLIEVDYIIPPELHDKFDYAPVSRRSVSHEELSEHQHSISAIAWCFRDFREARSFSRQSQQGPASCRLTQVLV